MNCVTPPALWAYLTGVGSCAIELRSAIDPSFPEWQLYLKGFGLTLLLEAPIYAWFLRERLGFLRKSLFILAVNVATHPMIWFVFPELFSKFEADIGAYVIFSELFAPLVEGLLLKFAFGISSRFAFVGAAVANLFSWWIGAYLIS
jgi:hypothetical protein